MATTKTRVKKPTVASNSAAPAMSATSVAKAATRPRAKKPVKVPDPPKMKNYVALVVDRSGSMAPYWNETFKALKDNFNEVRGQSIRTGQETEVMLVSFGSSVQFTHRVTPIADFTLPGNISANMGMTALFPAVDQTITELSNLQDAKDENVSFMIITLTDGENNVGEIGSLGDRIKKLQATDRWSFAFLTPDGYDKRLVTLLGLPAGNVMAWAQTQEGMKSASAATSRGIGSYFASRQAGERSTKGFFVTTDMSKVTKKDLGKLDDLSGKFKMVTVEKEIAIREFVEEKTGRPYVIGSTYYTLTKPETVQPQKELLIMEKNARPVYGGYQARGLLGLPDSGDAKVKPGNHANYDILVQSQSVNRKLVRGTRVLIDKKYLGADA